MSPVRFIDKNNVKYIVPVIADDLVIPCLDGSAGQ